MAFDDSQNQTQDDEQKQQQNQAGGQSAQLSGGGGGFAGQSGAAGPAGSNQPTNSGSWTNLNSYLSANADQSAGMGQSLANNVGQSAQNAQGALQQNQTDFNNQYSSLPTQAQADTNIQNTIANPTQDTAGSANVNQYQQYLNGTYDYGNGASAPASFQMVTGANGQSDYNNTQQAYTTAAQNLQNTQSESGRDLLLQNQYSGNGQQYNQGEQAFDQLLLQQNPGNAQSLNDVYNKYQGGIVPTSGTNGQSADLYNANQAAGTTAQNWQNLKGTIQNDASTALQKTIGSATTNVNKELSDAQSKRDADYNALTQGLKSNSLTPDQLKALGLTQGQQTYGVNAGQYLSQEGPKLDINQVATADDYATASALQALAAGQSFAPTANLGLGANSQASNIPSAYTFNAGAFNQAIAQNQAALQNVDSQVANTLAGFSGQDAGVGAYPGANAPAEQQVAFYTNFLNSGQGQTMAALRPDIFAKIQSTLDKYNQSHSQFSGTLQ